MINQWIYGYRATQANLLDISGDIWRSEMMINQLIWSIPILSEVLFWPTHPFGGPALVFGVWVNTWKLGNPIQNPIKPWRKKTRVVTSHFFMANSSQEDHLKWFLVGYTMNILCPRYCWFWWPPLGLSLTNKSRYIKIWLLHISST